MSFEVEKTKPYYYLECSDSFKGLTEKEQKYAYHMAQASWAGGPIVLHQTSHESPQIFTLFQHLFRPVPPKYPTVRSLVAHLSERVGTDISAGFTEYFGAFLGHMGNYNCFGSVKFVPRIPRSDFRRCVQELSSLHNSANDVTNDVDITSYDSLEEDIYGTAAGVVHIGLDSEGVSSYYSGGISSSEVAVVQRCLEAHHIRSENTRVAKLGPGRYRVRVASSHVSQTPVAEFDSEGVHIEVWDGGFAPYLARAAGHLRAARGYAANSAQERMIDAYVKHFEGGDIEDHKESQRIWVTDRSPAVETNIGFVETYGDPAGVRAEWEGFVAITDKATTRAYAELVEHAPGLVARLPWGPSFEKAKFVKPDFTAINILNFCTSNIPFGINIPNFDDVREQYGFKNVSLINVTAIAFGAGGFDTLFVSEDDAALLARARAKSFDVNVGLHELLGHGSGKVLSEDAAGNKNFDPATVVSPLSGKPVASWYRAGQTYDTALRELASPMEECRAEAVGLLLSTEPEVLAIFGHAAPPPGEVHDVTYANWLGMTRDGLAGFPAYNPETRRWGQAHVNARYAIMRQLMRFGVAKLELVGDSDVCYSVDRSKILTDGVAAIRDLLVHLQVFRATADYEGAREFFGTGLSAVDPDDPFINEVRRRIVAKKGARRVIVQCVPVLNESDGSVTLKSYEASPLGMIESYQDRYPEDIINPNEVI